MSNYLESDVEQAMLQWFGELGYQHAYGPEISPGGDYAEREDYSEVVLTGRLRDALFRLNPGVPARAIEDAVRQVIITQSPSMLMNNRAFHRMLTEGIDVEYRRTDGSPVTGKVRLFDWADSTNNDWLVVNQLLIIENGCERRPDVLVYVNGIPLVIIELKSESNENVGITHAFNQLQSYKRELPTLFAYNSFLVISDGVNARAGTVTADQERFMMWRTIDGADVAPLAVPQLEVLQKGMFEQHRFLDLIRHFVLFQSDGEKTIKILAGYHQYHAVNKAVNSTRRAAETTGDRKIGVIWHTQGSGKSLSMVFYTGKLVLSMDNPTIVVLTDRNDLDEQLFTTFARSRELLRQTPQQATSRAHLRQLLQVEAGGIIFTTIHKFAPAGNDDSIPVLTERENVIVIADEAHRSQYGFNAEVVRGRDEAEIKYGYAKYMRDALPNASYIGFTGTPVELVNKNTPAVFGNYIDVYDMTRAVEDGTTVKIFYESRIAKMEIPAEEMPYIDEEYEEITEAEEAETRSRLMSKWSRLEALAGAEKRVKLIARDIVEHFEARQKSIEGKGMIVAMSRRIAVQLYREIVALRPEWASDDLEAGVIKVIMTSGPTDPEDWEPLNTTKAQRETLARRMRDLDDPLKLVIVRDMWLTGFDAPCLHTLYVDKPMQGHNLMQAIARVNRVFADKPGGLVVDYIGIATSLKDALQQYTDSDRKTAGIDITAAVEVLLEKYEQITGLLHGCDYNKFLHGNAGERLQAIVETIDFVLGLGDARKKEFLQFVSELAQAYALCSTTPEAESLNVEIGFFKAVKSGIIKMIITGRGKRTPEELDFQINQLVSRSLISDEVVDILDAVGLKKPNIAILSDGFLEEVRGLKHKNLAVELLKRLLQGRVKAIARQNLVQSRKFSQLLEEAIRKYQNRTIETTQIILEMIELAKEMNQAHKRGEDLGLSSDELAFYDALGTNDAAVRVMGDALLKQIAQELTKIIKANMSIDWTLRENVQAQMRVHIKRLLNKHGYPPDQQPEAIKTVMEQAVLMCKNEAEEMEV